MLYVKSKFNILVPYKNGETIIFNGLTGAIGRLNQDELERYNSDKCTPEEVSALISRGILVSDNTDQMDRINRDRINGILSPHAKYIRIWTTSACNARCYYCYEKGLAQIDMTDTTADDTLHFIEELLECGDTLYIEWFGGEPLMNPRVIESITEGVNAICARKGCKQVGKIITNGSLIDAHTADLMKNRWHISSVQITLDGYMEDYDRVKDYIDPEVHNFERVIDAITLLNDRGIRTSIRMNYDTHNASSLTRLIDYLHEQFQGRTGIFYYVYPVWSGLNKDAEERFESHAHADSAYLRLLQQLVDLGMCSVHGVARLNYKRNQCRSCSLHGYTIFPNGDIGKCSETFIQTIGDVRRGVVDTKLYGFWTSPDLDEKCKDCSVLPLCQGGCRSSYFTQMPKCYVNRRILPDILRWYVDTLEKQNAHFDSFQ